VERGRWEQPRGWKIERQTASNSDGQGVVGSKISEEDGKRGLSGPE
jgi:hypothetical protein